VSWFNSLWHTWQDIVSLPARWWSERKPRKGKPYRFLHVEEFPDKLEPMKLYVAGENGYFWAAAMLCPCGCRDVIQLNLLKKARPCWSVEEHKDGTPTVMPSVWRRENCRSHFYLRRGQIEWCREYSVAGGKRV
jgi:Family of unknown function (DUF6527)